MMKLGLRERSNKLMADFRTWAIVELFGHQVIAGEVSEQVIAGQGFVRVDVPPIDGLQAYTKFYGHAAIYCITPTDEATAKAAVKSLHKPPVELWRLSLPEIPEHITARAFEES